MGKDPFQKDHVPEIGIPVELEPDIQVVTAPNAGPMTFTGTSSYILGGTHVALIDPGPDSDEHFTNLCQAIEKRGVLEAVIVTHAHVDHAPLASRFASAFGVPVYGHAMPSVTPPIPGLSKLGGGEGIARGFHPSHEVTDGDRISGTGWEVEVIHTPGHLADHICLANGDRVFSGDHVMGWATTMISPPEGDLASFMASLDRMLSREDRVFFPGHGAPVARPADVMTYIRDHRRMREAQILEALREKDTVSGLTARLYADVPKNLHGAAARNVLAHLVALVSEGRANFDGETAETAWFYVNGA